MKMKVSEMNIEQLRNHFAQLNRDQLLLSLQTREAQIEAAQHRVERTLPNESRQPSWCDDGLDDAVIGSLP